MSCLLACLLLCVPAAAAAAPDGEAYTDAGLTLTAGPGGYSGLNLFAQWGDDVYHLRPSLNTYSSDGAERYSSFALFGGADRGEWAVSAGLSVTPETGGYSATGLQGELTWDPPGDFSLDALYLGVFAGFTAHEDLYAASAASSGPGRRQPGAARSAPFRLAQYDYGLSGSARSGGVRFSARFTLTSYDKDIAGDARALPTDLGAIGSSGFPDHSLSLRASLPSVTLSPWAGYTRTRYLLDQPSGEALMAGLSLPAGPAEVSASWEGLSHGGSAMDNYFSLGLTWSF
ncbi:MAG: hypothetical protein RDU13_05565 [Elusimicrobiales bacterium]|nr:hypothetical protein [Elusimicrobiales bacterium]